MILGKVELLIMPILLSKNIAKCDDRAQPRGDRAAVGWAWTGRNLILDEALGGGGGGAVALWKRFFSNLTRQRPAHSAPIVVIG